MTQHELDFVDIDLDNDTPLFIDPHILGTRRNSWSVDASRTVRNFFRHFLTLVRAGKRDEALELFLGLREPNETRLGLSKGRSQGHGVGRTDAEKIFNSMLESKAIASGLVEDIEDTRLFIDGVDKDKTSDMTTNIIRRQLIDYTQRQCRLWTIPTTPNVPSGNLWDRAARQWEEIHTDMLVVGDRKLLLVPKSIVAYSLDYSPQKYHQHFVLTYLQTYHLSINSALVRRRRPKKGKPGARYVTKKSLVAAEAPYSKDFLTTFTQAHAAIFQDFKRAEHAGMAPLSNSELTSDDLSAVVDRLVDEIEKVEPGNAEATRFHRAIAAALELIFYPRLVCPEIEREINEGRKRIDLVFDNAAETGFFNRLHTTYDTPSQFIMVECKNYGRELGNPELDQMIGRFSPNRGKFGLIVCRSLEDETLFLQRCADSYVANHGIILPLTDADLIYILRQLQADEKHPEEAVLMRRFRSVALN